MSGKLICLKCGGVLIGFPKCPICDIPMQLFDNALLFYDHICNTCGKGFKTYEDILSHYCEHIDGEAPARPDAKPEKDGDADG